MKERPDVVIRFQDVARLDCYDVRDSSGRWCEGQVAKIDQETQSVYVSYLYWDDRYDEWIGNVEARIAPLHTHTYTTGGKLKVGQRIEVLDESQKWLECFVIEMGPGQAKVHYKGFHEKFDEWILAGQIAERVRPYGRNKTIPGKWVQEMSGPKRWRLPSSKAGSRRIGASEMGDRFVEPGRRRGAGKEYCKTTVMEKTGGQPTDNENAVVLLNNNQADDIAESNAKHDADERTRRITSLSEQFRTYSDALAKQHLSVVSVEGDGNCLFRAVAHQVYGDESYHMVVRAKCMDYMEVESDFFSQFVEGGKELFPLYLRAKRMDACWGDDPEIEALCELYNRRAEIWAFDPIAGAQKLRTFHETSVGGAGLSSSSSASTHSLSGSVLSPPRSASGQRSAQSPRREDRAPVIRLSYYGGGHYDSIVAPYHADTLLKRQPGETEEQQITRTQQRRQLHSSTTDRERAHSAQGSRSAAGGGAGAGAAATFAGSTGFAEESMELAQKASDSEATEQAALDAVLQESRRSYLSSDHRDLESCLLLSMRQYAQETGQSGVAAHIPLSKEGIETFRDKLDASATAEGDGNLTSVQDSLLQSVQEQSERDYYESAIISSLRSEGKMDDSALTEEELFALVAAESVSDAARREQCVLEDALRESAGLPAMERAEGGSHTYGDVNNSSGAVGAEADRNAGVTMESQPKAEFGSGHGMSAKSHLSSGSSSSATLNNAAEGHSAPARDAADVIHLSDLKEDVALEYALRQSLQQHSQHTPYTQYAENAQHGRSSGAGAKMVSFAPPEFQTEEEMLHFALEASMQGYTSADYADYKETHAYGGSQGGGQGNIGGNAGASGGRGSNVYGSGYGGSGASAGGGGYAVDLGAQFGGGSASGAGYSHYDSGDAEQMDEDLMRAIAESLRK